MVRRLGWSMNPQKASKCIRLQLHCPAEAGVNTTFSVFGRSCLNLVKSWCSTALRTGAFWLKRVEGFASEKNGREATTDQSIRTNDGRGWHSNCKMLSAHHSRGANSSVQRSPKQPLKRWKLSYRTPKSVSFERLQLAIEDMMDKTSAKQAPWFLVPANDSHMAVSLFSPYWSISWGRDLAEPPQLDPKVAEMAKQLFDIS